MPAPLDVLYLDNHLLVVCKPPGLLTQADHTGDLDLLTLAKAHVKKAFDKPGAVFIGLVHRLDRPASGVVALARTSKAAARLTAQFKARTPEKRYLALVEGHCTGAGTMQDYLAKRDRRVRVVQAHQDGARYAELQWRHVASADGLSLLDISLKTGRPHQIRLQLSSRGFPILGDFRYGARRELDGRNLALHSYALRLEHPTRKVPMQWVAAPPAAWGPRFRRDYARLLAESAGHAVPPKAP